MAVHYQLAGTTASEISASVESHLRSGALAAGDPLPPVRALAVDLGVSPATVAAAYRSLRQRGIIETAGRNGTRVRQRPPILGERGTHLPAVPAGLLDLSSGEPDARLLPRPTAIPDSAPDLRELARAAFSREGIPDAAYAIAGGALDSIERLLATRLRPGDRVAVEDPGWANLLDMVAASSMRAQPMAVDDEGPTPAGLRSAIRAGARAVVVTSRAHNPTGAAVTSSRAAELRSVLADHPDLLVIEDDHAAELSAVPLHPLSGATGSWAFIRSASKPYGPDLRLAVIAGDPTTIGRLVGRQRLGTGWVSTILQRIVASYWTSAAVQEQVAAARASYEARRTALVSALRERGLVATGRTGINVWVEVPDETAAVARLRDEGFAVAPGALYRQVSRSGLRITVSRLDLEDIERLAEAVARAAFPSAPVDYRA